jgi:hypothetical protein
MCTYKFNPDNLSERDKVKARKLLAERHRQLTSMIKDMERTMAKLGGKKSSKKIARQSGIASGKVTELRKIG